MKSTVELSKEESNKEGKVISFVNMKGGVGKTTLTINVAQQMVAKGYKVLVIDMDPQFNSTQSLLLHKASLSTEESIQDIDKKENKLIQLEDQSGNLYKELESNHSTIYRLFSTSDIVSEPSNLTYNIDGGLDLIPGNLKLSDEVSGDNVNKGSVIIKHINDYKLANLYDFILIDCPPTWSILTYASLFASDGYIIPSKVDFYSSLGISMLENKIENHLLEEYTFQERVKNRPFINYGIAFTLVHTAISAEETRIKKIKESDIVKEKCIHTFKQNIPHVPSVPSHYNLYSDTGDDKRYNILRNAIDKLVVEIIERVNDTNQTN